MNNETDYLGQLAEIRRMMEKSTKFMSLSGFSGIIIGCYALVAAWLAAQAMNRPGTNAVWEIFMIGVVLLVLSLATALYLTFRRSGKMNQPFLGPGSKLLFTALAIPLVTGGLLTIIFVLKEMFGMVAPALLIFYGLSLAAASRFSHRELLFVGLIQILLGLVTAWLPQFGLFIWAVGFGIVHVIYGCWMYLKYERTGKNLSA